MSSKVKTGPPKGKPFRAAGDDLEDNIKLERLVDDSVSSSDSESEVAAKVIAGAGTKKLTAPKALAPAAVGQKRKRSDFEKTEPVPAGSADTQAAAFWAAFTGSKTGEKLSDLEITSPLKADHVVFVPPSVVASAGTASNDVSDIAATLKAALPEWKRIFGWKAGAKKRNSGCPEVLLVTFAAPRAASMLKPLAVFNTRIAKLFAKHLTVEDQTEILKGPPVTIGIGTSNRLSKLVELGALKMDQCSLLLVDIHPDMKKYTMLNHPNLREDFFNFYRDHVHPRVVAGKLKLAFY